MTLRYNGTLPAFVTVMDNPGIVFPTRIINPGETFSFYATSGKFQGSDITVYENLLTTNIKANCSLNVDPDINYGNFTIVQAYSNSKPICCPANLDVTKPVITGCADIKASTPLVSTNCSVVVNWAVPHVEDCQLKSFTSVPAIGSLFPIGVTTVVYTAKDVNNNTATCSFTVTVKDGTPPVATQCPSDITVVANSGSCKANVTWIAPVFIDNCGVALPPSTNYSPGEFSVGTVDVIYSAADNAGNIGTCKFKVTVKDETRPVVTGCPGTITVTADASSCKSKATWIPPVFKDNCGVFVTPSHNPGNEFSVGTTLVTYSGKDNAGNVTTCAFNVIVKDVIAPVISKCPSDTTIVVNTGATSKTVVSWYAPVAADNCSTAELTSSHKPGESFPVGTTPVTYTAKDVSGNAVTCSFKINVVVNNAATNEPEPDLDIFQVITPDGNGVNDIWWIGNIEKFEKNKVVVVDRWGSVIYSATGYNNNKTAWSGENNNGTLVPTGTYFYTLTVQSGKNVVEKKGFIEVVR